MVARIVSLPWHETSVCSCRTPVAFEAICFFFLQAEDGIRDIGVTGVQTCALPICRGELDLDEHLVRLLQAAEKAVRLGRLTRTGRIRVENGLPGLVVIHLDAGQHECHTAPSSRARR